MGHLRAMLQKHIEHLANLKAEEMLDDSHNVIAEAEELGCTIRSIDSTTTRVCECGNVLMGDAIYCRKCGKLWESTELPVSKERETVVALACMQQELDEEVQKANAELKM